jgi:hypothetical protein
MKFLEESHTHKRRKERISWQLFLLPSRRRNQGGKREERTVSKPGMIWVLARLAQRTNRFASLTPKISWADERNFFF